MTIVAIARECQTYYELRQAGHEVKFVLQEFVNEDTSYHPVLWSGLRCFVA